MGVALGHIMGKNYFQNREQMGKQYIEKRGWGKNI